MHGGNQYVWFTKSYVFSSFLKVCVDVINTDLVTGMECGLCGKVDILLFNPPYVPTPPEEGRIIIQ